MSLTCHQCKKLLYFKYDSSQCIACGDCGAINLKNGTANDYLIKMGLCAEDMSVISVGTKGKSKEGKFQVTGRFQLMLNDAYRNLWSILYENKTTAWLMEGYGYYAVIKKITDTITNDKLTGLIPGKSVNVFDTVNYTVENVRKLIGSGCEGEMHELIPILNSLFAVELSNVYNEMLLVHIDIKKNIVAYGGSYYEFEQLNFFKSSPLGSMDVSKTLPGPLLLPCPGCGKEVKIFTHLQCISFCCRFCHHSFRRNEQGWKETVLYKNTGENIVLELHSNFSIKGRKYLITGITVNQEKGTSYYWREYHMFNPAYGYAFLSEYNGHWIFLEQMIIHPNQTHVLESVTHERKWFRLFNKYKSKVIFCEGEFCFDIYEDRESQISELVSPPYTLSIERNSDEQMWFEGEYLEPDQIKDFFKLTAPMPDRIGIGSCQPMKMSFDFSSLITISIITFCLLLAIQIVFDVTKDASLINEGSYGLKIDEVSHQPQPIVTPSFELIKDKNNLEISYYAPVDNSWVELGLELVNETTGETISSTQSVEYYHGIEDGETWREGDNTDELVFSYLSAGKYHLNAYPYYDISRPVGSVTITIKQNVVMWSNFLIVALVLCIFPLITYYRKNNFERKRWMNSNYSPYDDE